MKILPLARQWWAELVVLAFVALASTSCQMVKTAFGGKEKPTEEDAEYRLVSLDNSPFFQSLETRDGSDAKPSRFLKKGTKVKLLEEDAKLKFSKVEYGKNVGWMPSRLVHEKAPKPEKAKDEKPKDGDKEKTDKTSEQPKSPEPSSPEQPVPTSPDPVPTQPANPKPNPLLENPNFEPPSPIVPDPRILPTEE